jgi:hypothetical protein
MHQTTPGAQDSDSVSSNPSEELVVHDVPLNTAGAAPAKFPSTRGRYPTAAQDVADEHDTSFAPSKPEITTPALHVVPSKRDAAAWSSTSIDVDVPPTAMQNVAEAQDTEPKCASPTTGAAAVQAEPSKTDAAGPVWDWPTATHRVADVHATLAKKLIPGAGGSGVHVAPLNDWPVPNSSTDRQNDDDMHDTSTAPPGRAATVAQVPL